jgi:hypothetical protein
MELEWKGFKWCGKDEMLKARYLQLSSASDVVVFSNVIEL